MSLMFYRWTIETKIKSQLEYLTEQAFISAVEHGFYGKSGCKTDTKAELIKHLESEISELKVAEPKTDSSKYNPNSFEAELADIIIRILSHCGSNGIDIEKAIKDKMTYNKTRPYKHGKEY